ncbi:MAG: GNAT family N-acetyltransferase [Richelia sp. RM2_1_2]|nr:GNAT family N-acetyltransferase [Richelia sp. SM2_1_7]NJM18850.1 GNAT family N-acetyltransferase [Richelia sp. SM1_7_0]NJN10323.1 GNAT family N-acetyltransferase [Richelia sp. RM1_1_1]NJO28125.1 GNAT family N-acetyltransferase [Richelia sp. SL_2_1]NJO60825.1 GNAT family N-acetyltransferase [Richelia sp. RM2_1_2]
MNEFRYVIGVTGEIQQGLSFWGNKIREYVDTYYEVNRENARNTDFYRCISKTREITNNLLEKEDLFRSVIDDQNLLAAVCIIQETSILIDEELIDCLEIESLTNSPWNTIEYPQLERRKGAATSLVEGIILESRNEGLPSILKLIPIPDARKFYQDIGFVETDVSGDMILTYNAASMFLLDLEQKRNSTTFD